MAAEIEGCPKIALKNALGLDLLARRDYHIKAPAYGQALECVIILDKAVRAGLYGKMRPKAPLGRGSGLRIEIHATVLEVEKGIAAKISL